MITNHDVLVLKSPGQMIFGDGPKVSVLNYTGPCQAQFKDGNFMVLALRRAHETVRSLGVTSGLSSKCIMVGIELRSDHGLVEDVAVTQMWHVGVALFGCYNSVLDSDIEYDGFGIGVRGDHHLVRGCYAELRRKVVRPPRGGCAFGCAPAVAFESRS